MQKFGLLRDVLQEQGILQNSTLYRPGAVRRDVVELAHCPDYLNRFISGEQSAKEARRMGLPWSQGLVKRTLISPNGTLLTANLALEHGIACHLAGGTHHAHFDFASGYCVLNDLAITALCLLRQSKVKRVLIFDCDVHQGDGTATILSNESAVTTCSIHCEKNFPQRKADSDIDVDLAPGLHDEEYVRAVRQTLYHALELSKPDLILYDAGVDVFEGDPLGLLNISIEGIRSREAMVLEAALSENVPIATVIGGGYDRDEKALARRHSLVVKEAYRLSRKAEP